MELTNEFRVSVPVDEAWAVLTDVERIAPCMPGAELQEVEGEEYRGVVKVKVGPISAQYKGAARFVERDDTAKKAVLKAEGRDTRGQGNASATITAVLAPDGAGTSVSIVTDLSVTGKVAQFGRGVLADVSSKLLGQFVEKLEADVISGSGGGGPSGGSGPGADHAAVPTTTPSGNGVGGDGRVGAQVRPIRSAPAEPVDLLEAAGGSVAKRAVPVLAVAVVSLLVWRWFRRR
ncbi:MAG TPA: SRPBCC family protein [Acidimicrobiales bacterium]|nr:SRPBCC family protein [Acidimicrobiales bacterium]